MFKQLAIIPFLLGTPTIKNAVNIQPLYNKALTNESTLTGDTSWRRARIYDYGDIGPNNAYALGLSMRQLEVSYSSWNVSPQIPQLIEVKNIYYIEIKTATLKFNGSAILNSLVSYLPENWYSIQLKQANMTYETGYNIYDISTKIYSVDQNSNDTEINSIFSEVNSIIEGTDNGWQINRFANTSNPTTKANIFTQMTNFLNGGGYFFNYTRQYNEEISFIIYSTIEARGTFTTSEEQSYLNINQNAVNSIQWNITLNQSSPTPPTPTPTPDNYEVVDIGGLIFYMLGMPFAWMSTAFNLTIFPNTPYSINIGALFLGLVGVVLLIFILKKILK